MQIFKTNVSKSIALLNRMKLWLEDNKSFENAYQALSHDDELSLKLFHEEVLIAYRFVTDCRGMYFERHGFYIDDIPPPPSSHPLFFYIYSVKFRPF